jgi:AbiV family abortive infection protein
MRSATFCLKEAPSKALALGQLGQEEIGKSFHLLAAFQLPKSPADWRQFWSDWRNHNRKAAAAYFYEWLNPARIEVVRPDGVRLDGMPLREPIATEKEVGFYVDYHAAEGRFQGPSERASGWESFSRITTLLTLAYTAVGVHDTLIDGEPEFRFPEFSEIPARILSEFTPQEDIPQIYEAFARRSPRHRALIDDLTVHFKQSLQRLEELQAQLERSRKSRADA